MELPSRIAKPTPYVPMKALEQGLPTPTGKFEIKCSIIEQHPEWGLDAIPTYTEPLDDVDPEEYPFGFTSGTRIPNAIHSRLHKVPRNRSLRPEPLANMNRHDCDKMGVREGDWIEIYTKRGSISVKVHPTLTMPEGLVDLYHGYSEADAESILDSNHLDPYSGFPAYRSTRCGIRKKEEK